MYALARIPNSLFIDVNKAFPLPEGQDMASEFGNDETALILDSETGEVDQNVFCLRSTSLNFTEESYENNDNTNPSDRTRFRIPASFYTSKNTKKQDLHEQRELQINGVDLTVLNTQNLIPIAFVLPTLLLFPAWTAIFCAISEASIHIYFHKRNKNKKDGENLYRSPFNLITSEFCAKCRTEKWMQQISKMQDKRSSRRNLIDPSFIKHVVR